MPGSPTKLHQELVPPSSASRLQPIGQSPRGNNQFAVPAFSPSQIFSHAMLGHSVTGMPSAITHPSPNMLGSQTGKEESPQSATDGFGDFDFNYAQELMSKAGITIGDDQQLPLWVPARETMVGSMQADELGLQLLEWRVAWPRRQCDEQYRPRDLFHAAR